MSIGDKMKKIKNAGLTVLCVVVFFFYYRLCTLTGLMEIYIQKEYNSSFCCCMIFITVKWLLTWFLGFIVL